MSVLPSQMKIYPRIIIRVYFFNRPVMGSWLENYKFACTNRAIKICPSFALKDNKTFAISPFWGHQVFCSLWSNWRIGSSSSIQSKKVPIQRFALCLKLPDKLKDEWELARFLFPFCPGPVLCTYSLPDVRYTWSPASNSRHRKKIKK